MVQYAAPARRARHGKIARLPYPERDMVNRMLRDNIPYSSIVEALAEIGIRVTERNVSNWKTRGGYHDWRAEQDRAVDARLLQDNLTEYLRKDDAAELPEVGLQLAATQLSHFFTKPETQQQLATDPEKYARTISVLCRLAGQIQSPQKDRDVTAKKLGQNPARDKQEAEEEVENVRSVYSAARLGKSGNEANIPRRNYMPKA
jgi:hypothetical protein